MKYGGIDAIPVHHPDGGAEVDERPQCELADGGQPEGTHCWHQIKILNTSSATLRCLIRAGVHTVGIFSILKRG